MKHALIGILSAGVFALSIGLENASAQTYGPAGTYNSRAYAAPSRNAVRRGAARNAPLYNNSDSPEATGGGSLGYNQTLWNY
jgi:hypothetical protein